MYSVCFMWFFLLVTSTCDDLNEMCYNLQCLFFGISNICAELYFNHIQIFRQVAVDTASKDADESCQAPGKCVSTYKSLVNDFVSSPPLWVSFVIIVPWKSQV